MIEHPFVAWLARRRLAITLIITVSLLALAILAKGCLGPRPSEDAAPAPQPFVSVPPTPAAARADAVYLPAISQPGAISPTVAVAEVPSPATATSVAPPTPEPGPTPRPTRRPTATPEPLQLRDDLPALTLPEWPRPANDNGRCMHFLPVAYYEDVDLNLQIGRLQELGARWALVIYGDEIQLEQLAPRFRDAGIMVVWRKGLRANERYYDWGRDVETLQRLGMPPYLQLYNEPALSAEWDEGEPDFEVFREHILQAARDVYNAGGYVGLQFVDDEWLRGTLRAIKERRGEAIFGRMFFVPHPYALNHPPDYTEDANGVLGFRHFAQIFQEEIGFVPPMIAGEGGWKYHATDDRRFPQIDDARHAAYHAEVFNWFRTGQLSDGEPLPDYLFAFCPWLLSAGLDDSAWYDSFAGPRTATIEAVKAIPPFVRRFSWER